MNLSDMVPLDQEIEYARTTNPRLRRTWDASAFARAVAIEVVRCRAEHDLTQAQLAAKTGLTQRGSPGSRRARTHRRSRPWHGCP